MPAVGFETWYEKECPVVFKVMNIAPGNKRIRLFKYPIVNGGVRDLMAIPYVSEADIRHSLLKGELYIKIICKEAIVVDSNINLITFDECHKQFLMDAGITEGLEAIGDGYTSVDTDVPYLWKQGVALVGATNGANKTFMTPGDTFLNGTFEDNEFTIEVFHNGRRLIKNLDFIAQESGGVGTGYDTITMISFVPSPRSRIVANYVVENS